MKFTLDWLRTHWQDDSESADHTQGNAQDTIERLTRVLTALGLEVESVDDPAQQLQDFSLCRILEVDSHPKADRLRICKLDTVDGAQQVVCGAPNVAVGKLGVFAPPGSRIPGTGMRLKRARIRGQSSSGMLLSEKELGISQNHDEILVFEETSGLKPGTPIAAALGLDDPVLNLAVTPNRSDCLSVRGIARELAASGWGTLKSLSVPPIRSSVSDSRRWQRDLPGQEGQAPYVVGCAIHDVGNGCAPPWMQRRLKAIGLRPVSALVDITNYLNFDLGRPLHVYDSDKLQGDLTLRLARRGERILALDNRMYTLDTGMLVIADQTGIQGIAGVIGAKGSGCQEETTHVFVESALFSPTRVAEMGRRLGIETDARYRFERGLDPAFADVGLQIALDMIRCACGGDVAAPVHVGARPHDTRTISMPCRKVLELGGIDIAPRQQAATLKALGFEVRIRQGRRQTEPEERVGDVAERNADVQKQAVLEASPPSWRTDVESPACLVEEILRLHGYENIPPLPFPSWKILPTPLFAPLAQRPVFVRRSLAWRGLDECVTFSFLSESAARAFGGPGPGLTLTNPLSQELKVLRPSVLPTLLTSLCENLRRGHRRVALFEVGPQYAHADPDGQEEVACGVRSGLFGERSWTEAQRTPDVYDVKADTIAVLRACGWSLAGLTQETPAAAHYHPGRSARLLENGNTVAFFGELHPSLLGSFELDSRVVAFEVFLERLPLQPERPEALPQAFPQALPEEMPVSRSSLQALERDLAFVVDENVAAGDVCAQANLALAPFAPDIRATAKLFDVYAGEGIGKEKKSLALTVVLQPDERSLRDVEIERICGHVVERLVKMFDAQLRAQDRSS